MKLSDTTVVVLCHNRIDEVELNVPPRVDDVTEHRLELVVVDNASTDGTREFLRDLRAKRDDITLVFNDQNLGVGAGRNSGWALASREYIVTLDEDTRITTEELMSLVEYLRTNPRVGIVTPVVLDAVTTLPLNEIFEEGRHVSNFHGACYATRRDVIADIGYHDPECIFGGEELDLSIRARAAAWEVRQHPNLKVRHNARTRKGTVGVWRRERWTRNHARVMWRWFPYPQALLWSFLNLGGQMRFSVRRRAWMELPQLVRAWIAGAREGVQGHEPVSPAVVDFYRKRLGLRGLGVHLRMGRLRRPATGGVRRRNRPTGE